MLKVTLPSSPRYIELDKNLGRVEIDGCYPGYGTTLGNSIRRTLLSSLPGTAITSVNIKGVSHEFSAIPDVLEDVVQLILNLKRIRFKSHRNEAVKLSLKEKGEKEIKAAQIKCPAGVEVVNKDAHIATITKKKGELEMEIEIQKGLGYVPVEQQEREKREINVIAIDAVYTPVRRVNYFVENTRVGKSTDYDKITLEIETDGTITPREAYLKAVEILIEQFDGIKKFSTKKEEIEEAPETAENEKSVEESGKEKEIDSLKVEVSALSFSTRTMNVLEKSKIKTIGDLVNMNEDEIINLEGMGEKGLKEIKKAIGDFGLTLKQKQVSKARNK